MPPGGGREAARGAVLNLGDKRKATAYPSPSRRVDIKFEHHNGTREAVRERSLDGLRQQELATPSADRDTGRDRAYETPEDEGYQPGEGEETPASQLSLAQHRRRSLPPPNSNANSGTEPTYCTCGRPSFGDMIKCDNENCKGGEWFHYECVGLGPERAVRGRVWYCPTCRAQKRRRLADAPSTV